MCPAWVDRLLTKLTLAVASPTCLCCTLVRTIAIFAAPSCAVGIVLGYSLAKLL